MPTAPLAATPPHTIKPFRGASTTVATMIQQVKGARGERSVLVRGVTERVVAGLQPKDYLSEILAIRNWVAEKTRFLNDPLTTEWVKDPQRIVEEILAHGISTVDCDEIASLALCMCRQVGREGEFVTVGFGSPGRFSHVLARVKEPKSGAWIVIDPVAGTDEGKMLRRERTHQIWRLD